MENREADVVIIGGGIIGLFCAYYLAKEGKSVIVIERGDIKEACSYGNCGLVSPSHAMPLNSPELILKALGWLFQEDSPFYIRPQLNFRFLGWMIGFALNAKKSKTELGMIAINSILKSSRSLYDEFFAKHQLDCNWATSGIHFVFGKEITFEDYRVQNEILSGIGLAAKPLIGNELFKAEPALSEHAYGSWFYENDASLNPGKLLVELKQLLVSEDVLLMELCEVLELRKSNNRISEIITSNGIIKGDSVILATGAWSSKLEKQLGLKIPIIPGKGYSITMKSPALIPKSPCIFNDHKVVATPWKDGYRLGGTMEFSGYNTELNQKRIQNLKKVASMYLKDPYTEEDGEEWYGWRPMTNDGKPIIDQSPLHKNLFLACGHNMLGLSMAPSTGKIIAELVSGKDTHIDITPFSLKRF